MNSLIKYSVQKAVYHCSPELWLRKIFPNVIHANPNLVEKLLKMLRSQEEMSQVPDESEDIFKRNMLDSYRDSPDGLFDYRVFDILPNTTFQKKSDWKPVELSDEILGKNVPDQVYLPVILPMCFNLLLLIKIKILNFMPTMPTFMLNFMSTYTIPSFLQGIRT